MTPIRRTGSITADRRHRDRAAGLQLAFSCPWVRSAEIFSGAREEKLPLEGVAVAHGRCSGAWPRDDVGQRLWSLTLRHG
jgi:hypothetical protein